MAQNFKSFAALMVAEVLPLHKKHPDWIRLVGAQETEADGLYIYQHED
ncbi:MAG: hypothetical protein Q7T20_16100 [Saprospiraceae bacterium]|nr:hypothetical protein [Saprospiraceae bacterium]